MAEKVQPYRHAPLVQELINSVLTAQGETSVTLRETLSASAASQGGETREDASTIPADLDRYAKKVGTLEAYRVTDEEFQALRAAGYSEDAIFEITISSALGAGIARLNRGLSVLKKEDH